MFPILWRFLLSQYLKVMLLCAAAIVMVLLTTRLEDVARFASLDASISIVLLFVLNQIPYILPIAIPVSCLISSILLVQRLSKTHELTAMRACGIALKDLMSPILLAGAFLSVVNFYFVSEMATASQLNTSTWKEELRSVNPLLLLRNKHLMKVRGAYFDALGQSRIGESAGDVVMAMPNKSNQRISLAFAQEMKADRDHLISKSVSLVTAIENGESFDHLIIENIEESDISADEFAELIQRKSWSIHNDYLKMPLLLSRLQNEKQRLREAKRTGLPKSEIKPIRKSIDRGYSEIMRRVSAALAAFTFTLMGASFGISISRHRSSRGVIYVIIIAAVYLASYFTARGFDDSLTISSLLYFLPHLLIAGLSVWMLKRVSEGIDRG